MLNYSILSSKPTLTNKHGESYKDLLGATFTTERNVPAQMIIVNKYYVARPDLISFAVYGTDEYADIICKMNGISNPFELNEDMPIYIPDINFVTRAVTNGQKASETIEVRDVKENTKVLFNNANSENDTLAVSQKTNKKKLTDKRTPAQQLTDEQNYVIDRTYGVILY